MKNSDCKVLAVIPARGGSKGIPHKNIVPLCGKPLLVWAIDAAKESSYLSEIIVSTDSDQIASVAMGEGARVIKRPCRLATDKASVLDAVFHVISGLEDEGAFFSHIVLLEPTAPQRTGRIIDLCITKMVSKKLDSVATFSELDPPPGRVWKIKNDEPEVFFPGGNPWLRRQEQEKGYFINGAVYATRISKLKETGGPLLCGKKGAVITPGIVGDIDTVDDLVIMEHMFTRGRMENSEGAGQRK